MKINAQKTLLSAALIVGLGGMAGIASAQQFTIQSTVTNAVTIVEDVPFNFGTLFATTTKTGGLAADSARLTMSAQGTFTAPVPGDAPPILSLGGQAAGAYTIPGLPIGSNVAVELQDANGDIITNGTAAAALCDYDDANEALTDGRIIMTAGGPGSGTFSAFFCVDAFTARSGGATVTAALLETDGAAATGFAVTGPSGGNVPFTLGATLIGQSGTTVTNFEDAAYSGEFNMEVIFK